MSGAINWWGRRSIGSPTAVLGCVPELAEHANVRNGSPAAPQNSTTLMAASGGKAAIKSARNRDFEGPESATSGHRRESEIGRTTQFAILILQREDHVIIRRLAGALREQNWFTVVLEVMIIVVGIFIGLQVDGWNEERKKQQNIEAQLDRKRSCRERV